MKIGISKKSEGQMRIFHGSEGTVNRIKFFSKKKIDYKNVVFCELAHGSDIRVVIKSDRGKTIKKVDGLVTGEKNICLTVTLGDCLPVYFYDQENQVIGIVHAGWRGIVSGAIINMIKIMKDKFNSHPNSIKIKIGPHIKKCHFEIKKDILNFFKKYPEAVIYKKNKIYIDLEKIVKSQLLSLRILDKNISQSKICTYCNKKYFSFRRDKPKEVVSQIAYICQN